MLRPSAQQLKIATGALADVMMSGDLKRLRAELIEELDQRTEPMARTPEQEATLRALVRLADVEDDQGIAEEASLDDGGTWHASRSTELNEQSCLPLRRAEVCDFLSRGYEHCARSFDGCHSVQTQQSWPLGHAAVFTWTGNEPHPAITFAIAAIDTILDIGHAIDPTHMPFGARGFVLKYLTNHLSRQALAPQACTEPPPRDRRPPYGGPRPLLPVAYRGI